MYGSKSCLCVTLLSLTSVCERKCRAPFFGIQFRRFFSGNNIFAKIGSEDLYACVIFIFESMNEQE